MSSWRDEPAPPSDEEASDSHAEDRSDSSDPSSSESDAESDLDADFFATDDENDASFYGFFPEGAEPYETRWHRSPVVTEPTVPFRVKNPGPTQRIESRRAIDYLSLYLGDDILGDIVRWTNENASMKLAANSKPVDEWKPLTLAELKAFVGVKVIANELLVVPRTERLFTRKRDRWPTQTPGIWKVFKEKRYREINRYLYFSDPRRQDETDKLRKVRPFLDHMLARFRSVYRCDREVSVDEAMIPFKGRLRMKQFMKDKPTKWGVKAYVLAESKSGYNYNFEIYCGKTRSSENSVVGQTGDVVLRLVSGLEGRGHHVYCDRLYSSPLLAHNLATKAIYFCGTLLTSRKLVPRDIQKGSRELTRGQSESRFSGDGEMCVTVWQDRKPIYFISTIHASDPQTASASVDRRSHDGTSAGVPCPPLVADYNKHMGGVDKCDQNCILSKSRKYYRWYKKLCYKVLQWAMNNAYILEGYDRPHLPGKGRKRDLLQFKDELVNSLIGDHSADRKFAVPDTTPRDTRLLPGNHFPLSRGKGSNTCVVCRKKHYRWMKQNGSLSRRDNPFKLVKTVFKCRLCDAHLCIKAGKTCWEDYHSKVEFWH